LPTDAVPRGSRGYNPFSSNFIKRQSVPIFLAKMLYVRPPEPLLGLCPWTPLGISALQIALTGPPIRVGWLGDTNDHDSRRLFTFSGNRGNTISLGFQDTDEVSFSTPRTFWPRWPVGSTSSAGFPISVPV